MWAGEDSNLRRLMPTDLQSVAFDRFATCPSSLTPAAIPIPPRPDPTKARAGDQIRTGDLLITSQLLYQLSYASICLMLYQSHFTRKKKEKKNQFQDT